MYIPFESWADLTANGRAQLTERAAREHNAYGRLRPGRTVDQAQAELRAIGARLAKEFPATNRLQSLLVMSELNARLRQSPEQVALVGILFALSGLLLLTACGNVANLLLARSGARSKSIAMRLALGAGRPRLLRELLTGNLVLALLGGVFGVLLAWGAIRWLASVRLPSSFPIYLLTDVDARVLIFSVVAAGVSVFAFGLVPAMQSARTDLMAAVRADGVVVKRAGRFGLKSGVVVAQIALATVLVVCAFLLVTDFSRLLVTNPGFRTDHILMMTLDSGVVRYNEAASRNFYNELLNRVRRVPRVASVALGQHAPLGYTSSTTSLTVEGFEMPQGQSTLRVGSTVISDGYLEALDIRMVEGRSFDARDTAKSALVAIVNQTMARQFWPRGNAVGGRIRIGKRTLEVVGVAKDHWYRQMGEGAAAHLYMPYAQVHQARMTLFVVSEGDPASLAGPVLSQVHGLDRKLPVHEVDTLQHFVREGAMIVPRLMTQIITCIGLIGLLLAIAGLYGVITFAASQRTREFGIRMALGASRGGVFTMVLRQAAVLAGIGVALGLALSFIAAPVFANILATTSATDVRVLVLVTGVITAISVLAALLPAFRACRSDPSHALRHP